MEYKYNQKQRIMKTIYTLILCLFTMSSMAQVETEITNYLNLPCNVTICEDLQYGACPGDINSVGQEYPFTDYQIYYVTENVNIEYNSLTLRNCRIEFRDGASLIDNGIEINFEQDCDTDENITGFVFIGGGNRFSSMAEYQQTLSIEQLEQQGIYPNKIVYYDLLGKQTKPDSKGLYIKRSFYPNNIVKTTKVIH